MNSAIYEHLKDKIIELRAQIQLLNSKTELKLEISNLEIYNLLNRINNIEVCFNIPALYTEQTTNIVLQNCNETLVESFKTCNDERSHYKLLYEIFEKKYTNLVSQLNSVFKINNINAIIQKNLILEKELKECKNELFECNERLGEADVEALKKEAIIEELRKKVNF